MSARLRRSTLAFFDMQQKHSDPEDVDLAHAGLYLVGAQVIACVLLLSFTATACSWLQPASQVSAVRSLAATTVLAMLMLKAPLRVGSTRGVVVLFNALRPCAFVYLTFMVVEQLLHSCETPTDEIPGHMTVRRIVFHGASLGMIGAALLRASAPTSENDLWFLITLGALLVIAVVPPPSLSTTGPLCGQPTAWDSGERILRAVLFSAAYVTSVYVKPPRYDVYDITISVIRCSATSIWILGCSLFFLLFAPLQVGVAITARVRESNALEASYTAVGDGASDGELDVEAGGAVGSVGGGGGAVGETAATPLALEHVEGSGDGGYGDYGNYSEYGDYGDYGKATVPADAIDARVESIVRRTGFQELSLLPAPQEEPEPVPDPSENYGGTPVDPTQLSALVGAPRLGV